MTFELELEQWVVFQQVEEKVEEFSSKKGQYKLKFRGLGKSEIIQGSWSLEWMRQGVWQGGGGQ